MKIQVDDNGYLVNYCLIGDNDQCTITVDKPDNFDAHVYEFNAYKLVDGTLIFDEDKVFDLRQEEKKNEIRIRRKQECYKYIDRSQLWYNTLTDDQKQELTVWYDAWLNAPETGEIPETPDWIKG